MIETRALRYFIAVATLKSISRAAVEVRISQPALSRQIRLLEEDLGVALLLRHGRGVGLTEAGRVLLEAAQQAFGVLDAGRQQAIASVRVPRGQVVFGIVGGPAGLICDAVVQQFGARFPRVTLRFLEAPTGSLRDGVASGDIDLALLNTPAAERDLTITPLVTEGLYLCCAPCTGTRGQRKARTRDRRRKEATPSAADDQAALQAFVGLPLITTTHMKESSLRLVSRVFAAAGLETPRTIEVDSITIARELLLRRRGFSLSALSVWWSEAQAGQLVTHPVSGLRLTRALALRPDRRGSRAVVELERVVLEIARDLVVSGQWVGAELIHGDVRPAARRKSRGKGRQST